MVDCLHSAHVDVISSDYRLVFGDVYFVVWKGD